MTKRFSRVVSLFIVALLPFVSSCKQKTETKANTVVVWHWMTDRDPAFQELAKKYKAATGVDVQFQLYAPSDNYQQKVRVGAQTDTLPEIFGVLGEARDLASFVEGGYIANLDTALGKGKDSWYSTFYAEALQTASFKADNPFNIPAGTYGIPIDVTTIPMIYNKTLFTKAGLDANKPPKTWDEFLEAGKKIKASGVSGFVSGWGETWLIYSLFTDLAFNSMGEQKVMDTFRGKIPYTSAEWIPVFTAFEKMHDAGFADSSLVTLPNKNAEQSFSSGRAGMTFNGSWAVNVYSQMNPDLDFAAFKIPALNPKNPQLCWSGAGTIFSVNAKSKNQQLAIDFLKWLSSNEQAAYLANETKNLPAVKTAKSDISPVLKGFATDVSIHPNRFAINEDPKVQEVITKGIQLILIGEKTAKDIIAEVQQAKEMASTK